MTLSRLILEPVRDFVLVGAGAADLLRAGETVFFSLAIFDAFLTGQLVTVVVVVREEHHDTRRDAALLQLFIAIGLRYKLNYFFS